MLWLCFSCLSVLLFFVCVDLYLNLQPLHTLRDQVSYWESGRTGGSGKLPPQTETLTYSYLGTSQLVAAVGFVAQNEFSHRDLHATTSNLPEDQTDQLVHHYT